LLDKQFFGDNKYHPYLSNTFIPIHAVRGEQQGNYLYEHYSINATPTVLIAKADGTEIDRVIGFEPPADDYRNRIEESYTGNNTTLNLINRHLESPGNIELAVDLSQRLLSRYRRDDAAKIAEHILADPAKAKKINVTLNENGKRVTGYEFGMYLSTITHPENVRKFMKEFTESGLTEGVFSNLRRFLNNDEKRNVALKVYKELIGKYPDNPDLVVPYISFLAASRSDYRTGLKLAERLYSDPENRSDYRLILAYADLLIQAGNDRNALRLGNDFIEQNPEEMYFSADFGHLFHNNAKYSSAFEVYERGIKGHSDYYYLYYAIGRTAAVSGENLVRGEECLLKYLEQEPDVNPSFAAAHWRLGMIKEHMGEVNNAIEEYQISIKLDPGYSAAREALERLKK